MSTGSKSQAFRRETPEPLHTFPDHALAALDFVITTNVIALSDPEQRAECAAEPRLPPPERSSPVQKGAAKFGSILFPPRSAGRFVGAV